MNDTKTIEDLEAERRSLAYAATQGDPAARARLEEVERELGGLRLAEERETLARQEAERLAVEAQTKAERDERQRRAQLLQKLADAQCATFVAIEQAVVDLCMLLGEGIDRGDEVSNLILGLGGPPHSDRSRAVLSDFVGGQLARLFSASGWRASPFVLDPPSVRDVGLGEQALTAYSNLPTGGGPE